TGRVLGRGYDRDTVRYAVGGGALVRLGRHVALAGDLVTLLDRGDDEALAWSAALQLAIPYTPHTLSLHATNTNTATLQGSSKGIEINGASLTRWGFEFTIPVTLSRYFGGGAPVAAEPPPGGQVASGEVARVGMRQLAFAPASIEVAAGTTVEWRNDDQVVHVVRADDGSWDSGDIAPGATWRRTFDRPGTYTYTCTPHPFMKGVVRARAVARALHPYPLVRTEVQPGGEGSDRDEPMDDGGRGCGRADVGGLPGRASGGGPAAGRADRTRPAPAVRDGAR